MPTMFYPDGEQTTTTPTPPDVYYVRTREDLLQYEDARFNSLIQAVANYYSVENDQSLWGDFLRAIAQELARFEYDYAYDILNKNPIFLTPPDIQRRFAAPLYINRLYPTIDPEQHDLDYKMMLVSLIPAYRRGATVQSLEDIITAYTGLDITVLELYKFIGQGFFDQSDRNAISVSVNVGGNNPLDDIKQLNQLQAITNALSGAIDLGKPAHVGLEFKTVFGADENIDAFVTQGTSIFYPSVVNPNGITDRLRIFLRIMEAEPFNPMLFQAPDLLASTPRTGLGPSQLLAWQGKTAYAVGQMVLANGFFQVVTTAGISGTSIPAFNPTFGANTSDGLGTLVWTNAGSAVGVILYPTNSTHNPGTAFSIFSTILDSNGFLQVATVAGTSYPAWEQGTFYALNTVIIDADGFIQKVTTAGTSGISDISNLYYPPFDEIIGQHTTDGSVVWQTQALYNWNTTLGGVTLDGSVIWVNIGPPPGLVAPRLARAWEIKNDQLATFETS
jgi:hypothetical protein